MQPYKIPKKPRIEQVDKGPDKRSFLVLPFRASTDKRLTIGPLRVLLVLASYCNRAGVCWVGQIAIGQALNISPSAVCRHMQKLEKLGYIRTVAKGWPGLRAYTRQLIFNPDISAEDACAIANDPAPFIMRQAEQLMTEIEGNMPRKRRIDDKNAQNLRPDDVVETSLDFHSQTDALRQAVGDQLFAALLERCGPDATPDQLQSELRRMLA